MIRPDFITNYWRNSGHCKMFSKTSLQLSLKTGWKNTAAYKQKGGGILYNSDILRVRPGDLPSPVNEN